MPNRDIEKAREYGRKYRAAHPEKTLAWRAANPEKVREYARKWRAANSEKAREIARQWYAANPERAREVIRKRNAANPGKNRAKYQRRRARKAGNGGSFTASEWFALCAQYNNQCIGPGPHDGPLCADHIIPVSKPGGTSNIDNIQPLCRPCNTKKGTKTIDYRWMPCAVMWTDVHLGT